MSALRHGSCTCGGTKDLNRRQMLNESMRSLSKALPAFLGAAGALGGLLKCGSETIPRKSAGCFPAGEKKPGDDNAQQCSRKENVG